MGYAVGEDRIPVTAPRSPKPQPPAKPARLSEAAIAAAPIEAAGGTAEEIGRKVGVNARTVHEWRKIPAYRSLVKGHRAKTEAAIRDDLLDVRREVLDGVSATAKAATALVVAAPDDLEVVSRAGKLLLDLWRSVAAQTGITEATKHEVSVSAPDEALRELEARLRAMPPEAVRKLTETP